MSWKEAATLLLIRPLGNKVRRALPKHQIDSTVLVTLQRYQEKHDYEIYVGIRDAKMKFFASALAFPGGAIEAEDRDASKWQQILSEPNPAVAIPSPCLFVRLPLYQKPSTSFVLDPRIAFRLCAIRELAEETGMLLSARSISSPISDAFHTSAAPFADTIRTLGRLPALNMLYDWRCWLTPKAFSGGQRNTHRFDTIFYMAFIDDESQQLSKIPRQDVEELGNLRWSTVPELMADYSAGKLSLPPPQLHELATLLRYPTFNGLRHFVTQEMHHEKLERFLPIRAQFTSEQPQLITLLPGDSCYPKTTEESVAADCVEFPETWGENCAKSDKIHRAIWMGGTQAKDGKPVLKVVCNFDRFATGQLTPVTDLHHFDNNNKSQSNL